MPTEHRTAVDLVTRAMPVTSVNADARTAQVIFSTGAAVRRRDWMTGQEYFEELEISATAIDMTRLQAGAPLLNVHGAYRLDDVLGVVESAAVERGQAVATVRFSARADVEPFFRDVRDGIIRNVSVGYSVQEWRIERATEGGIERRIAIRWTPHEISLVPIGADPAAGVRSGAPSPERTAAMQQQTDVRAPAQSTGGDANEILTRERERIAGLQELLNAQARQFAHLPRARTMIEAAMRDGRSVQAARDAMFAMAAEFSELTSTRSVAALPEYAGGPSLDDPMFRRSMMVEALSARLGGPAPSEAARQFVGVRLIDLARDLLEHRGERTQYMSTAEVLTRSMHATGDFAQLLTGTGDRLLRRGYETAPSLRRLARRATARDYRPINRLQLSNAPIPLLVNEGGEVKYGTMSEGRETYRIGLHSRGFRISRQALINDDLTAFAELGSKFARSAAEGESIYIVNLLTSGDPYTPGAGNGPTMSDGVALFNAAHGGNVLSGAGSVLSAGNGIAAISAARAVMRLQKDLDGKTPINAEPRYLLVPAALETVAQQLVTQLTPNQVSQANPFSALEVVVDPRLDAASTTGWYLLADSAVIDTLEFSYLDGFEGPRTEAEMDFDTFSMAIRVVNEFGAGAIDWRGMVRNVGA